MESDATHSKLEKLLKENTEVTQENNVLLKKLHRNAVWSFWIRLVWYAVLFGLPFILYFYVLEPYFEIFGSNYETFKTGVGEIPGLKGLDQLLDSLSERSY